MADPSNGFHYADYLVFASVLVVSIVIGLFVACRRGGQHTTSEYLVGGRSMSFLPVAVSLMVTFESSIMLLGLPSEMYFYGVQWWLATVGNLACKGVTVVLIIPMLYPLKITSAYEYLQLRFNSTAVRLLASVIGIVSNMWYIGIVLYGPAIALEAVTGFPQWASMIGVAVVAVIYTSIGGLKAVIWTDVFQACIMYSGLLAILIKGTIEVGSPSKVWEVAKEGGRLDFFNFDFDPRVRHTFWNLFVVSCVTELDRCAFNQATVQRISATKSVRDAQKMMLVVAPFYWLVATLACYMGIVSFAYYSTQGCDPLASGKIANPNQIIPFTVMDLFMSYPGMPGLFFAALFCASLSTLSTSLSSISALLWADFLKPRLGDASEFKATFIVKVSVVISGVIGCGVGFLVSTTGGTLTQVFSILIGAFTNPLLGIFLLGCFNPYANSKGALVGGIVSLVFSLWLSLGQVFTPSVKTDPWLPLASTDMCLANDSAALFNTTATPSGGVTFGMTYNTTFPTTVGPAEETGLQGIDKMYSLSYRWIGPVCIFLNILLGSVVSLITGGNKDGEVDPRYYVSLCCCLPQSVRNKFRCGEKDSTVKSPQPPPYEVCVSKETVGSDLSQEPAQPVALPMIGVGNLDQTSPGNDDGKLQEEDRNGGSHVRHSSDGKNDVVENGKTNKDDESYADVNMSTYL